MLALWYVYMILHTAQTIKCTNGLGLLATYQHERQYPIKKHEIRQLDIQSKSAIPSPAIIIHLTWKTQIWWYHLESSNQNQHCFSSTFSTSNNYFKSTYQHEQPYPIHKFKKDIWPPSQQPHLLPSSYTWPEILRSGITIYNNPLF